MENIARLIQQASSTESDGPTRMEAVQTLKAAHLTKWDVQTLCAALEREEHPAHRATAGQVLGYHRIPGMMPEVAGLLSELASRERDPGVIRAIAFALRGREDVCAFLNHTRLEVREEAVLGVPLSGPALGMLLEFFFKCRDGSLKTRVAARLRSSGGAVIREVVEFLLTADLPEGNGLTADLELLLHDFPQEDLYPLISTEDEEITRTHREIWSGIRRRDRKRLLAEVVRKLILGAPSPPLMSLLLRRLRDEESFYHRNVRFLRQVFGQVRPSDGQALLSAFRRLGDQTRGSGLSRLAEMLSVASRALPAHQEEAQALLRSWVEVVPEVGLRMYHLRLRAPRAAR